MAKTGKELVMEEIQYVEREIEDVTASITQLEAQLGTARDALDRLNAGKANLTSDKVKLEKA